MNPADRDPLDDLLSRVAWPDPSPASTDRLRALYLSASNRQLRLSRTFRLAAAVAFMLTAFTAVLMVLTHPRPGPVARVSSPATPPTLVPSRPANAAEVAVMLTARSRLPARHRTPTSIASAHPVASPRPRANPADVVAASLQSEVQTRAADLAPLRAAGRPATDLLFSRLDDPHVEVRLAAARLLGRLDGPDTTARLAAMVAADQNRREALAALLSSDDPHARAFLQHAESRPPLQATVRSVQTQMQNF